MSERVILHCDCNSFYASVEAAINPEYKNVPMAVCGSESDRHGIVLAKNELAKKYGIKEVFILSGHLHEVIEEYFKISGKTSVSAPAISILIKTFLFSKPNSFNF